MNIYSGIFGCTFCPMVYFIFSPFEQCTPPEIGRRYHVVKQPLNGTSFEARCHERDVLPWGSFDSLDTWLKSSMSQYGFKIQKKINSHEKHAPDDKRSLTASPLGTWKHHPLAPRKRSCFPPWHLETPHQRLRKRCLDESWALLNEVGDPKDDETGHCCLDVEYSPNKKTSYCFGVKHFRGKKYVWRKNTSCTRWELCHLILFLVFVEGHLTFETYPRIPIRPMFAPKPKNV